MRKTIWLCIAILTGCNNQQPQTAREMEKVINKSLNVGLFDSVHYGKGAVSFADFRKQHELDRKSVV